MAPISFIVPAVGSSSSNVTWNSGDAYISFHAPIGRVEFRKESDFIFIDDICSDITSEKLEIRNYMHYIPVRSKGEIFGVHVIWDVETMAVTYNFENL